MLLQKPKKSYIFRRSAEIHCIGTVNVMVFKKKSTYKKERDQKRWTMFMAQHETAIQFQFFNVPEAECISFMKVSRLTVPDQKKRIQSFKGDFSIKGKISSRKILKYLKLSTSWKRTKKT